MMNSKTKQVSLIGLAGLGVLCTGFARSDLGGSPVPIGDRKAFHGAHCQDVNTSNDFSHDADGARNDKESRRRVICPLFRDAVGTSQDLNHIEVEVFLPTSGLSECTAYTMTDDAASESILDFRYSAHHDSGSVSHHFVQGTTEPDYEGTYWVECVLNQNDEVNHIYVNEGP